MQSMLTLFLQSSIFVAGAIVGRALYDERFTLAEAVAAAS